MINIKHVALAASFTLPVVASANTLLCLENNPCYDSNENIESIMEFGEERPFEMKFEQAGSSVGLTHSEAMAIAREYTYLTELKGASRIEQAIKKRELRGKPVTVDQLSHDDITTFDPVEFTFYNGTVSVVVMRNSNSVIIRREDRENARVEISYDAFIAALKDAYAYFSGTKLIQEAQNRITLSEENFLDMVVATMCASSGDIDLDFCSKIPGGNGTYGYSRKVHASLRYHAYRSIIDREGETKRDATHCEKVAMKSRDFDRNETAPSGFVSSCAWSGGDKPEMKETEVDPQVYSHREAVRETVNGQPIQDWRKIIIEIDGEDTISLDGDDERYDDFIFSGFKRFKHNVPDFSAPADSEEPKEPSAN